MSMKMTYRVLMKEFMLASNSFRADDGEITSYPMNVLTLGGMDRVEVPYEFKEAFRRILGGEDTGYRLEEVILVEAGVILVYRNNVTKKHVTVGPELNMDLDIQIKARRGNESPSDLYYIDSVLGDDEYWYPRASCYRDMTRRVVTFQEDGYALIEEEIFS